MATRVGFTSKETAGDVRQRREKVLLRYEDFKGSIASRRQKLEQAKQLQQFHKDADSLDSWIKDKIQIASDETHKDRRNLQVKIQKHQAFEAEIAAHNNSIFDFKDKGRKMIDQEHFATEAIKKRIDEIASAWDKLLAVSADKRQKLQYAQKGEQFIREADEVLAWMTDRIAIASTSEPGKDLEHVELLQKKFEEFKKDIQANEGRIVSTNQLATKLVNEQHPDSDLILSKQKLVNESWMELKQLSHQRQLILEGAHEVQKFNRAVEETGAWMNEKSTAVLSDDFGRDLASVQALQRKHEGLERDLDALEIKVQEISEESERLRSIHTNSADQIAAKQAEISMLWENLKHKASKRGSKLQEAQKFQRFLADYRDLMSWVDNMKTLMKADELAKDISGAEALLKRHRERKGEIDAQEDSFKTTMQFGQTLLSENHFASEEIKDKLENLAGGKRDLLLLWNQRKVEFDQCNELMVFVRDAEQMENWIAKQESVLSSDDERDTLESVEGLIKKHENFEKSLAAQEEKFKAIDESATIMISNEHYAATEIDSRRKSVLALHKDLLSLAGKRKVRLQDRYQLQQFLHDSEEIRTWIFEKTKIASDESYKDPTNLEAKSQQHTTFEAELQANRHRMETVVDTGHELISNSHYAKQQIQTVCDELDYLWSQLEELSAAKGKKLEEACNQQKFDRSVKDVDLWLDEVENQLNTDELGKDLAGVKKLQNKLSLLETDIAVHTDQIDSVSSQANQFIADGHFDSDAIQQKRDALVLRYERLQDPIKEQKQRLKASGQLQQFLRDVDDEEAWIKEREPIAMLPNRGSSLVGVQNLQKKHNALMVELSNREGHIKAVVTEGEDMISNGHYGSDEIQSKVADLESLWQQLKDNAENRKQSLIDSYEAQQYFADALEAELWMKDMEPVVGSSDYGKDEDMAEALLKKHEAVAAEVMSFGTTVEGLSAQSAKCNETVTDVASVEMDKQFVKVQHNFSAHSTREVSAKKGEILTLINASNKEWWKVETQSGKQGFIPANYVKRLPPTSALTRRNASSFNMSIDGTPQESVQERQDSIKRKYANLQRLAKDRKQRLEESKKRFALSREKNELQHWISDKVAFVSSEEVGKDLEHVETLKKKFEAFQSDLSVNEAKLGNYISMAETMVQEGHTEAEEIQGELEDLNSQWESLVQSTATRKQQLEEAHNVQMFIRASDETKLWMNEKSTAVLSDDFGRDLASVQALQRKHEGLERDLAALEEKVKSVTVESGAVARTYPQAVRVVKSKEKEVMEAWNSLKERAEARKVKLVASHDLQQLLNDYRDLTAWTSSMQALVSSQELATDVGGAQALLSLHKEHKTEIEAKKGSIQAFISFGKQLIAQAHYDSSSIKEKLDSLSLEVATIEKSWQSRQQTLEQCLNLQLFNRDAEQAERWIGKKEAFLSSEEMKVGTTSDTVENLLKKHEDFAKTLQTHEGKIAEIQKFADQLVQNRHYAAVEIAERRASVLASWAKLKESLVDWRSRLGQSQSLQTFNREIDEAEGWIADKYQIATDESYRDPTNLEGKLQKHDAFEAEVAANKERMYNLMQCGKDLIESQQCPGQENEIEDRIKSLEDQWTKLIDKSAEKTQKLKEANQEQQFNEGIKDLDYWLQEMEAKLTSDDLGRDMTSVEALLKKHSLVEADIEAHHDRVKELKSQSLKFTEAHHFDALSIQGKQKGIEARYERLQELANSRKNKLENSLTLQKFFASMNNEDAWIKEKKLLASSTDYGKDLFGVQKHLKNHQQLEDELNTHEQTLKTLLAKGNEISSGDHLAHKEIESKCNKLQDNWKDLNNISSIRRKKLEESLAYHEFCARINEEESWLTEKQSLYLSEDYGDSLAAVEGLLSKHEAFETDLAMHQGRIKEMEDEGEKLIKDNNYQASKITLRLKQLKQKLTDLEKAATKRLKGLNESKNCLQFFLEADTIESWIKNKQAQLRLDDYGRDVESVQTLLLKHESFEAGLSSYKKDGIDNLTAMKGKLLSVNHVQLRTIQQRYNDVIRRWEKLQKDSESHRSRLQRALEQFKKLEELFLQFAKKASSFNSSLSNIEEDLSDPVRCNTLDEIQSLRSAHQQLQQQLTQCRNDFKQIQTLDRQIKSYSASSSNPYTWFTSESLDEYLQNTQKLMKEREVELNKELRRQQENEDLRKMFARQANSFYTWLTEARTTLVDSSGTLETQLESVKRKSNDIENQEDQLKRIEELGAKVEEVHIFDNKYTEHTPVSLTQQWNQLRQMRMRIQHNLEQQILARSMTGVSEEQLREFTSTFRYFDKNQSGKLEHQEFKACLRSLGYELLVLEQGEMDPKFESILDQVDPNRLGFVSFEEYMTFMISRETDNVQSMAEVEEAFAAISGEREKLYITKEELTQALSLEQAEYCMKRMPLYRDSTGTEIRGAYDYKQFTQSLF